MPSTSAAVRPRSAFQLARRIGSRYVRSGSSNSLVAFMSAIAIGGLALGVALLITVLSVVNGFEREVRENVLSLVPHLTVTPTRQLSSAQWAEAQARLGALEGVSVVTPVISSLGLVATSETSRGVLLNGFDPSSASIARLSDYVVAGNLAGLADARWQVAIGATLAAELGVSVGESIDVFSPRLAPSPLATLPTFRAFRVAAITRVGNEALDEKLVTLALPDARALLRSRSAQTAFHLQTDDVLSADATGYRVRQALGSEFEVESWTASLGAVYRNIEFSRSIIGFMLWMLVAVAAFNLVVSLVMIVRDKRDDVAILMTLGADSKMIAAIFLWQGLAIAAIGVVLGTGLGLVGAYWVGDLAAALEQTLGIVLLDPGVYPIDFLPSAILLSDVVGVGVGVLMLALIASLYPALQAASMDPVVGLRGE